MNEPFTNNLEKRMYFLVPYNISPIQQAIQAGHSMGEYALKYGRFDSNHLIWEFLEKWKTWIILNGGTTNFKIIEVGGIEMPAGSLNQIQESLEKENIEHARFIEPDLNEALSAVCLIVDERVFNREDYPDFREWLKNIEDTHSGDSLEDMYCIYKNEVGSNVAFLKDLLNTKKLA